MSVSITTTPSFTAGNPSRLLSVPFDDGTVASVPNYDVAPDGSGFVILHTEDVRPPTQIHVILNWFESLRQQVGVVGN